jgi:RecA-family ATPase
MSVSIRDQNGHAQTVKLVDPRIDPDEVERARRERASELEPQDWEVIDFVDLRDGDNPNRGEEIIEGLLRDGEVGFIGSVSKAGKSWLVGFLIWCVITGHHWFGKNVKQGKVLLIDNELKPREVYWRHTQIVRGLSQENGTQVWAERDQLKVICRRGKGCDIQGVAHFIGTLDLTDYSLIVIDAIYKTIPNGKSENDNEAMGKLMNILQGIAESKGVALMCVHHATKGDQSHKTTLDILAGAGSFGRSLDAMIALRDHEQEGLNVIEFRTRTNPDPEAISVKFEWPVWSAVTVKPALRQIGQMRDDKQKKDDQEADEQIIAALERYKKLSESQIVRCTGMGPTRVSRAIGRAMKAGKIEQKSVKRSGKKVPVYFLIATPDATPE